MSESPIRASVLSNLDFRWNALIRSRLEGISDDEYLWEPIAGCLSVHPDAAGGYTLDSVGPAEFPLGNIAWRMTPSGIQPVESSGGSGRVRWRMAKARAGGAGRDGGGGDQSPGPRIQALARHCGGPVRH